MPAVDPDPKPFKCRNCGWVLGYSYREPGKHITQLRILRHPYEQVVEFVPVANPSRPAPVYAAMAVNDGIVLCEHCGAETPENTLGPIARFCSATCRFAAAYREKIASGKCRKARCESDAEEGKTYCRTHLDALAAADRQRRQQRSAETRKAA